MKNPALELYKYQVVEGQNIDVLQTNFLEIKARPDMDLCAYVLTARTQGKIIKVFLPPLSLMKVGQKVHVGAVLKSPINIYKSSGVLLYEVRDEVLNEFEVKMFEPTGEIYWDAISLEYTDREISQNEQQDIIEIERVADA